MPGSVTLPKLTRLTVDILCTTYPKPKHHRAKTDYNNVLSCTDPLTVAARLEALAASRQKMQDELDAKAALFREKQQQVRQVVFV